MNEKQSNDGIAYHAYDINLTKSYSELVKMLETTAYSRKGISQEEYLSRIREGIDSYSKYHKLGSLDSALPIILKYPAYNFHAHLAFQLMTFDINKIYAMLDYQHEHYVGLDEFIKIVEHGVYDWIIHNSPFDNNERLQKIMEWVEKRRGVLHKTNKIAIKIGDTILEQFKKANCDVGHIIMMQSVNIIYNTLNPIEKKLFNSIINGLILDGFIDFNNNEPNFFRLAIKGFRRIYDEEEKQLPFQDREGNDILPTVPS